MASPTLPLFQDPRITANNFANLNGQTYHYILGEPSTPTPTPKATIFLIHGWPDLSTGWRFQIPTLLSHDLRVIALDMMGYGQTAAPTAPPASLHLYGFKRAADDIAELARQLGCSSIMLGGHDWGGAVVYRVAQWYPQLVAALFSVCTPYFPLASSYVSTQEVVRAVPQFAYQLHLASGELERRLTTKGEIRGFLNAMYGGRSQTGEVAFDPFKGVDFEVLERVEKTKLVGDDVLDYYADQFARNGLHGPCNWYRTREANFKDEQSLERPSTIQCPVLFILATKDNVLTRDTARGIEKNIPNLTQREVDASHWALWQTPAEVNGHIQDWLENVVFGDKSRL